MFLHSHSALNSGDVCLVAVFLSIDVSFVDLLLDSLDGLVGERLVFEHYFNISDFPSKKSSGFDLQKVSSSSVRLYVSGYMKYTNKNSNVIQPQ